MCWVILVLMAACRHSESIQSTEVFYTFGKDTLAVSTVIDQLKVPWEILEGPNHSLWFNEQQGKVWSFNPKTGKRKLLLVLTDTYLDRTSGLLGMALSHDMEKEPYLFLAYTSKVPGKKQVSRIVRYTYSLDTLINPVVILEYPAWTSHFGARLKIAPDNKLMVTTGDGDQHENAQNIGSPNGKILRFNLDGSVPDDNPIPGSPVWAWGLRNSQGLTYGLAGKWYISEHGDAIEDEVNMLRMGANYGWPEVEGYVDTKKEQTFAMDSSIVPPLKAWTPTIAPAAIGAYNSDKVPGFRHSLILATLKQNALHILRMDDKGDRILADSLLFEHEFGRLRSVCVTSDGEVYIGTSNKDWNPNGVPQKNDDRILRIRIAHKRDVKNQRVFQAIRPNAIKVGVNDAEHLYQNYCASCHKSDGNGVKNTFPSLNASVIVRKEDPQLLISTVLNGRKEMPAFNFLDKQQLAAILTYVRDRFGDKKSAVTEQMIAESKK